jgi:hypothetical protein
MSAPIVFLTDFGDRDPFVGIMKGVVAMISPSAPLIDLTNKIPPGDIQRAAMTLWQAVDYFPDESVFLVVVDPGVGTSRKAMLLDSGRHRFIGPDNGVFSFIADDDAQGWELSNPDYALPDPGTTFHGRDIFAPGAAYAWKGIPGPAFGEAIPDPIRLPDPLLDSDPGGALRGEILHADHFGNLLTSLGQFRRLEDGHLRLTPWLGVTPGLEIDPESTRLHLPDGTELPWARTFAAIPDGACAAIIGSSGLIEIATNGQSAAEMLGLGRGDAVILKGYRTRKNTD